MSLLRAFAMAVLAACKAGHAEEAPRAERTVAGALAPTAAAAVHATHGAFTSDGSILHVDDPTFRAVAPDAHGDAAGLRFTYLGPSAASRALASGQLRRQVGLKLRAADGCNLVYVMWRIEPGPGLEVSVKRNPGDHDNGDCGTKGYQKLSSSRPFEVPALEPNVAHTLEARISDDDLTAWIDGQVAWRGTLPASVHDLTGPAGMRSDNVAVEAELLTAPARP